MHSDSMPDRHQRLPDWISRKGLPRNVLVLSWVSFFADAASEMLYPVFPTFVTQTLGASPAVLGLIEGVAEGTASVGKAISGRLADRQRRRPMIALRYGISTIAKPIIGLARAWPLALVGRFVDRAGKGIRDSPRDAVVAADTSRALRGRGFGFQRAFDTAGAVVGPLAGIGLYEALGHKIRPLFLIAVIPGAISVALVFLVRERSAGAGRSRAENPQAPGAPPGRVRDRPGRVRAVLRGSRPHRLEYARRPLSSPGQPAGLPGEPVIMPTTPSHPPRISRETVRQS